MLFKRRLTHSNSKRRTDGTAVVPRRRLNDAGTSPVAPMSMYSSDTPPESSATGRRQQFRRNQTLTGSSSDAVVSAAEMSGTIQSPRATTHHLRHRQRALGLRIMGLFVASGVTMLFLYGFIADIHVSYYGQVTSGSDADEVTVYEELARQYLSERPLERLRPFLHTEQLVAYMNDRGAAEVREITSVTPAGLGSAQIAIKMREPVVAWTIDGQQRYVDHTGYIFTENHYTEPGVTVVDESGISSTSDVKTVASSRFLQFIGRGVGYARAEGLAIDQVIIPADTTRQVQFAVADKARTRIKLSVDRPVGEQVEDAARAYRYLAKQGTSVRYIDVRVSGRAYYINT